MPHQSLVAELRYFRSQVLKSTVPTLLGNSFGISPSHPEAVLPLSISTRGLRLPQYVSQADKGGTIRRSLLSTGWTPVDDVVSWSSQLPHPLAVTFPASSAYSSVMDSGRKAEVEVKASRLLGTFLSKQPFLIDQQQRSRSQASSSSTTLFQHL